MATPTILAATPVVSARQWTTGLAPRDGGGWKFITQSFNYDNDVPTEWVLIDIEEGVVSLSEGPNRVFSNSNYQVPSANTGSVDNNQIRDASGRIFFPERSNPDNENELNIAYYDPDDEAIHQIPTFTDPSGDRHSIVYKLVFDNAGTTLYGGTQAVAGDVPYVFALDPATLAITPIGSVGTAGAQARYAYSIAKDEGPGADFLYVAVGQEFWELVSIDLTTNTPTTLITTSGPGFQFIELEQRAEGWSANVYDNGVQTRYWLADGAISPYPGAGAPPGGARTITPYQNPLASPPELDWSRGIGFLLWRPNGSTGEWTEIEYQVTYTGPIDLESLAAQQSGVIIGNAQQYNGFFNYRASSSTSTWFGNWPLGVSQPALCVVNNQTVYISGYPSGATYRYNPQEAWAPDGTASGNPSALGSFGTDVRYPYFLIHCEINDRLYAAGRQERDSLGSGVGYYDIANETFTTEDTDLDEYTPRGFVVLEDEGLVVFSGELLPGAVAPEAELVVYDLDLVEQNRWVVQAGLQNTGLLCETNDPQIVFGLTTDSPILLYRMNVVTGELLDSVEYGAGLVGGYAKRPADGSLWVEISQDLVRINVNTLEYQTMADLEINTSYMAWLGSDLYMISGAELRYLPGEGTMANLFQAIPSQAGNGAGAAVDFSAFGPPKTIIVSPPANGWAIEPIITIEISNEETPTTGSWAPLCTFSGPGVQQVNCACLWMRAKVANYNGGGAPVINVGGVDEGALATPVIAPTGNGTGTAVDISGLGLFKTVWVGNSFTGALDVQISCDDDGEHFGTVLSVLRPGRYDIVCAAKWMRVRRAGVTGAGTAPLVAVGGAPA